MYVSVRVAAGGAVSADGGAEPDGADGAPHLREEYLVLPGRLWPQARAGHFECECGVVCKQ